jgi:hypothetical protein
MLVLRGLVIVHKFGFFERVCGSSTGAEAADEAVRAVAAAAGQEGGDGGEVALLVPQTPRPGPPEGCSGSAAAGAPLSALRSVLRTVRFAPHSFIVNMVVQSYNMLRLECSQHL